MLRAARLSSHLVRNSSPARRHFCAAAGSMDSGLVSVEWLAAELQQEGAAPLRVLDASLRANPPR